MREEAAAPSWGDRPGLASGETVTVWPGPGDWDTALRLRQRTRRLPLPLPGEAVTHAP